MIMKTWVRAGVLACAVAAAAAAGTVGGGPLSSGAAALAAQNAAAGTGGQAVKRLASGTAIATAPAAAQGSAVSRCLIGSLSAGLHGSQALNANRGFMLTLTNTGSSACSLDGYPGLGIQDASHHVLASSTHWGSTYFDSDPGASLIVLSPGETVSADFAYATGSGSQAAYLLVTPPNAFQHLTVPIPGAPVQITGGKLFVTAMARHTPYNT
jgi:hypothetical protein